MAPKLELISFKLCPFVQRAVIILKQKDVDFDITYIDLNNPPEWFTEISPLGQVPVLRVGKEVLFESSVIQEYVDEITPPSFQPQDPLIKAKNRAWISFGSDILFAMHGMITVKEEAEMLEKQKIVQHKLEQLEAVHSGDDFFNGNEFNMIDAAYAPMFMRINYIKRFSGVDLLEHAPKLAKWSDRLLELDCVQTSVVEELPEMYYGMIKSMNGAFASKLRV